MKKLIYKIMCLSPVAITRSIAGRKFVQYVPCGYCNECIKDRQNEYVIRTIEEAAKKGSVWFFTLTYSDNHVPCTYDPDGEIIDEDPLTGEVFFAPDAKYLSICNKDITYWKKRVRARLNKRRKKDGKDSLKFSFLICGEYGPRTHRPHYHGLFIGLSRADMLEFKKDWENHFGFTLFKPVNCIPSPHHNDVESTARYVAKYICKSRDLEDENVLSGKVHKPRKLVSPGYGLPSEEKFQRMKDYHLCRDLFPNVDLDHMTKVKEPMRLIREIINRRKYLLNGKNYKLPRYYKRKIFYTVDELTGKIRPLDVQRLVSETLEMDFCQDYLRQFSELVSHYPSSDPDLAFVKASNDFRNSEEFRRQETSDSLRETNLRYLRKSKF